MRILFKAPGEAPHTMIIPHELDVMQQLVGGYIETVPLGEDIVIICNEEGKIKGLPANFYVEAIDDIIVGNAFFCKAGVEDFTDISENDAKWICKRLGWPV